MLEGVHIFAGLKPRTLEALEAACRRSSVRKGALIVREGTSGKYMFLIGQGSVEVVRRAGSTREVRLIALDAGDFFGEMSIIECRQRSASIRAMVPTVLYRMERKLEDIPRWPEEYAILIFNIARDLCRRLRAMDDVFAGTSF
jgi:CRP-like cAMP-binding protein